MKKNKKILLATVYCAAACVGIVGVNTSVFNQYPAKGIDSKVLTLNSENAPTTATTYQETVNYTGIQYATFTFYKVKAADNALCQLNTGGGLTKADNAKGLTSIAIQFDGELTLKTGFAGKDYDFTQTLTESGTIPVCADVFGITANEETVITSLTLTYNCLNAHAGHDMDEWYVATPSTHSIQGVERRDCKNCNYYETRALPLLEPTGIEVTTAPTKTVYDEGEYFDPSGMVVSLTYEDESTRAISDYAYSPMGVLTRDINKIAISYDTFSVDLPITVNAVAKRIAVTQAPTKTNYAVGEDADLTGIEVTYYDNGTPSILSSSQYYALDATNLVVGCAPQIVLSSDNSVTTKLPITVTNQINVQMDHITKATGSTVKYADNETLMATAVNNDYIANLCKDDVVTIPFTSVSSGKAKLFVNSASTYVIEYSSVSTSTWWYPTKMGDVQVNKLFQVFVNDVRVDISNSIIFQGETTTNPNGDVKLLAKWKNVELNNVDVLEGANEIKIVVLEQIYKNADVKIGSQTKTGLLSSPVLDTVSIQYNCETSKHVHSVLEVADDKYLKTAGTCESKAVYYKSCSCGLTYTETFEGGYGPHTFANVAASEDDTNISYSAECTLCHQTCSDSMAHATVGVAKSNASYSGGSDNYYDLGKDNLIGTNNLSGMKDTAASAKLINKKDRGAGSCTSSTESENVEKALKKGCGHDYLVNFYNGAGFKVEFNATQAGYRLIIVKAASGYCDPSAFHTGDMQFNLLGYVSMNDAKLTTPDSYILYGKDGGNDYGVAHANWQYLAYVVRVVPGTNTFKFISEEHLNSDNKVVYHDAPRDGKDSTMATPKFDSVAVFDLTGK